VWLREELEKRHARQSCAAAAGPALEAPPQPSRTPMMPSKHLAFFR